jgi:hypothetical protein
VKDKLPFLLAGMFILSLSNFGVCLRGNPRSLTSQPVKPLRPARVLVSDLNSEFQQSFVDSMTVYAKFVTGKVTVPWFRNA